MSVPQDFGAVIHLDLRAGAAALHSPSALRARVAQELGRAGLPEPDDPLFLVVDSPAGLTDHRPQYELVTGYRAVGEVRLLVLLVGSAPGSFAGEEGGFQPDRRLLRPSVLRAPGSALLWAGDLRSARTALEQPAADDPDALAALVDVLSVPDVYLSVLHGIQSLPEAVAAPGVRLLEQDLPPEVRDRAWRDALTRFAGEDTELDPDVLLTASSGADLPEPLRRLVVGRGGQDLGHREPGGVADDAHRACVDALDHAEDALAGLRTLPGLLRASRREAFEADVDQARQALDNYRDLVTTALRGGGTATSAAESATRLAALGLRVPSAEGMGERIGEGLKEFAQKLLGQGLALRSVAQRFTGLAGRAEPLPGTALLPRLAPYSAEAVARQTGTAAAAAAGLPVAGPLAAAWAGLLGALWWGPWLALAVVVPLLFVGMAMLGAARLRGAGRPGRWAVAPRVAAIGGAAVGAGVSYATEPRSGSARSGCCWPSASRWRRYAGSGGRRPPTGRRARQLPYCAGHLTGSTPCWPRRSGSTGPSGSACTAPTPPVPSPACCGRRRQRLRPRRCPSRRGSRRPGCPAASTYPAPAHLPTTTGSPTTWTSDRTTPVPGPTTVRATGRACTPGTTVRRGRSPRRRRGTRRVRSGVTPPRRGTAPRGFRAGWTGRAGRAGPSWSPPCRPI
ncbi:hypothetical protein [Streptomyces sp. NBC_00443]|uniref:hypothetical protein n=1 Tax=Streptomyces sp. NBC_00443 TaxID=2975743 RepID=UPI002E1C4AB3